jgi:murein L,D-transpeptidase YafK
MIHGLPNSIKYAGKFHRWYDWTNGCIGVTNKEMDEIWRSVKVGTEIVIKP